MPTELYHSTTFVTFRETGLRENIDIGIVTSDAFYLVAYKKDLIYSTMPFLSLGFTLLIFTLLAGGYRLSWLSLTYFRQARSALSNNRVGTALLDSTGTVWFYNHTLDQSLQLDLQSRKRAHYEEIFRKRPEVVQAIQTVMASSEPVVQKFVTGENNHRAEFKITVTPATKPFKWLGSYWVKIEETTDMTSHDRIRIWSNAVQKIVHDIKSPLSTVSLNLNMLKRNLSELLSDNIPPEKKQKIDEDIQTIRNEVDRITKLSKNFLSFSRLEKPRFQIVNVHNLIDDALSRAKSFTHDQFLFQTKLDPEYEEIWADPQQIMMVFQIIIENAIQAQDGKGIIEISSSLAQYLDNAFEKFLEFEIADTGPGIPEKDHERIFEPFFTTKKEEGTGMGLPIARKIIEEHGGRIGIYSKSGFGTVIRFSVQLYEENVTDDSK